MPVRPFKLGTRQGEQQLTVCHAVDPCLTI